MEALTHSFISLDNWFHPRSRTIWTTRNRRFYLVLHLFAAFLSSVFCGTFLFDEITQKEVPAESFLSGFSHSFNAHASPFWKTPEIEMPAPDDKLIDCKGADSLEKAAFWSAHLMDHFFLAVRNGYAELE